jgi:hypothetical protein
MTPAIERFSIHVNALNGILAKTKFQKDKGKHFYKNKARDILFRLEALCRVYREIQDKKIFDAWYKRFKMMEDVLGVLDYHESLNNEFSTYKELKKTSEKIYLEKFEEEAQYLSEILKEEGWQDGRLLGEFSSFLAAAEWKSEEEDAAAFGLVMSNEIDKVVSKYREGELNPYKLEEGVHEFRRRIRWVSIYAAASNGLVQLRSNPALEKQFSSYCTAEVMSSPFNVMPKQKGLRHSLVIQSANFYALSWLISELGSIKDDAFRYENFITVSNAAGKTTPELKKKFLLTCNTDPAKFATRSEELMDNFIYRDMIPERIRRDIKRSL